MQIRGIRMSEESKTSIESATKKNLRELNEIFGDGEAHKQYPKAIHRLVEKITKANSA